MIIFKETEEISEKELRDRFIILNDEKYFSLVNELVGKKILYKLKNGSFSFNYVGLLIIKEFVIFCIPKYYRGNNIKKQIKQLLLLFQEYNKREKLVYEEMETFGEMYNFSAHHLLSVMIFLLNDYKDYGLYTNKMIKYQLNGTDEINWPLTINKLQPYIIDNDPIYLEYFTYSQTDEEENYIRALHKYVLTKCSKYFSDNGLSDFFGFRDITFEIDEEKFSHTEYILMKIQNELSVQYINRKQRVLKALYSYISHNMVDNTIFHIDYYGTKYFNLIWERTCAFVLNSQADKYKNNIDSAIWCTKSGIYHKGNSIIPDIISIRESGGHKYFLIADAKYYDLDFTNESLRNYPGVGDVTKQYLYQLSLLDNIIKMGFNNIVNMFLFPTDNCFECKGKVIVNYLKKQGLEDIFILMVPAEKIYKFYINRVKIDVEEIISLL